MLISVLGVRVDAEFVRVDYDVAAAANAILSSELPDDFAEYLRTGGKPPVAQGPRAR